MKWYFELRLAWLREPPADWYMAGRYGYKPPEHALKGRLTKPASTWSDDTWRKAQENTLAMGRLLGVAVDPN